MPLVGGDDPHMPWQDAEVLLAGGDDRHMPRQDDVAGKLTVIFIDDGV